MQRLLAAVELVAALFLLAISLLTSGNVLLRDVFSVQVPDWYDGARMLLGIALFWGVALATYYGSHICVDALWEHLDGPRRRQLDIVATLCTLAFLVPLAWMVWVKVAGTGTQGTMDLRMPLWMFYSVAAVGTTVAVLLAVARIALLWRGDAGRLRPPALDEQAEATHVA